MKAEICVLRPSIDEQRVGLRKSQTEQFVDGFLQLDGIIDLALKGAVDLLRLAHTAEVTPPYSQTDYVRQNGLGIDGVGLAPVPAQLAVGAPDLCHRGAFGSQEASQAGPV